MTGRETQSISYVHRRWAAGPVWFGVLAAAGPTLGRMTLPSGIPVDELDPGIRPQDDLFRHASGRWLARTEIPADRARYGAFLLLADEAEKAVREIVEEAASAPAGSDGRKLGDLYASFMDAERTEQNCSARGPSARRSWRHEPSALFRSCWRRSGGWSDWESGVCTGSLLTPTLATRSVTWCFSTRLLSRCRTRATTGRSGSLASVTRSPVMCSACSSWPGCRTPTGQPGECSRWRRRWLGTTGTTSRAATARRLTTCSPGPVCCLRGRTCAGGWWPWTRRPAPSTRSCSASRASAPGWPHC